MPGDDRRTRPFHWWGPRWERPEPRGVAGLVADGTLDLGSAARLALLAEGGASLVVCAGPSHAGKTTLLTACAALLPPEVARRYPRGAFESFAFLAEPGFEPGRAALLVNEISPHLPVYLWGPGVAVALRAAAAGCQLLTTAHARSGEEFVRSLAGPPLRVPLGLVGAVGAVAVLRPGPGGRHRLAECRALLPTAGGGLTLAPLDCDDDLLAALVTRPDLLPRRPMSGQRAIDAVRAAIAAGEARYLAPPPPRWPDL